MSVRPLVLHIGTQKTGTSSVQRFLIENRARLEEQGVLFPIMPHCYPNGDGGINGLFLLHTGNEMSGNAASDSDRRATKANRAFFESELRRGKRMLLSCEWLHMQSASVWNQIGRYLQGLGIRHVHVVYYLRPQDSFLTSLWKEYTKNGTHHIGMRLTELADELMGSDFCDYDSAFDKIEAAFESASFSVRRYSSQLGDGIYRDFIEASGLAWDPAFTIPGSAENVSLSMDVTEALREINRTKIAGMTRHRILIPAARKISSAHPDPKGLSSFEPAFARRIVERYKESNRRIEERFFDNEALFDSSVQEDENLIWRADQATIEKIQSELEGVLRSSRFANLVFSALPMQLARNLRYALKRRFM